MNCPPSSPYLVILPFTSLRPPGEVSVASLDPTRYSPFLAGRLSEGEFQAECGVMRAAIERDPELATQLTNLQSSGKYVGVGGPSCLCCAFMTCSLFLFMCPMLCVIGKIQRASLGMRAEWLRVVNSEIARLNATYGARGLRFELGQDIRAMGPRGGAVTAAWIAVSVLNPNMAMMGGMQMPMQAGMMQPMPMHMGMPMPSPVQGPPMYGQAAYGYQMPPPHAQSGAVAPAPVAMGGAVPGTAAPTVAAMPVDPSQQLLGSGQEGGRRMPPPSNYGATGEEGLGQPLLPSNERSQ